MKARFYSCTEAGTEQVISHESICDAPHVGDKVKLNDVWREVIEVRKCKASDGPRSQAITLDLQVKY